MKRTNRLISLVMTLLLLLTSLPVCFAEDEVNAEVEVNYEYLEDVALLSGLGIYDFADAKDTDYVTRAQFSAVMTKLLGYDGYRNEKSSALKFSDVTDKTEYYQEIGVMLDMKMMNGVNDTYFMPTETITYMQAIKVIVSALGYSSIVEQTGGYPDGYISYAGQLGLLVGKDVNYTSKVDWALLAAMLEKAIEADVMEVVLRNDNRLSYYTVEDETILSAYHKIYKSKGVMTDNGYTAIDGASKVGIGNARIGNVTVEGLSYEDSHLIGNYLDFYYRYSSEVNTYLYATPNKQKNNSLTLTYNMILGDDSQFGKNLIVYEERGKRKTAKIDTGADLIYNGGAYADFTSATYKIKNGSLELIDTNADDVYDIIKVLEYEDIYVTTFNEGSMLINSPYRKTINLNDYSLVKLYDPDGKEYQDLSKIPDKVIMSAYISKDNSILEAYFSEEDKDIKLKGLTQELGVTYVTDDEGNKYAVSATLKELINKPNSTIRPLQISWEYTIYLNYEGDIAMYQNTVTRYEYAYALHVALGEALDVDRGILKAVVETGDCIYIKTAKTFVHNRDGVKLNGTDIINIEDLYNHNSSTGAREGFKPQLVKIKRNAKGELTEIETAPTASVTPNGFTMSDKFSYFTCSDSNEFYNSRYGTRSDTVVFRVDDTSFKTTNPEDITVAKPSAINSYSGTRKFYDVDHKYTAGAIVTNMSSGKDEYYFYVSRADIILDENGEDRIQAEGYWKDAYHTFRETKPGIYAAAIKAKYAGEANPVPLAGDVFKIGFNSAKQEVLSAELMCSPLRDNTPRNYMQVSAQPYYMSWFFGHPVYKDSSNLALYIPGGTGGNYFVMRTQSTTKCYRLVAESKGMETIKLEDVPVCGSVNADGTVTVDTSEDVLVFAQALRGKAVRILVVEY